MVTMQAASTTVATTFDLAVLTEEGEASVTRLALAWVVWPSEARFFKEAWLDSV